MDIMELGAVKSNNVNKQKKSMMEEVEASKFGGDV